jgi:hypothetical protein
MVPIDRHAFGRIGIKSDLHDFSLTATRNKVVLGLSANLSARCHGLTGSLTSSKQAFIDIRCQSGTNGTVRFRTRHFESDHRSFSHSALLRV